MLCSLQPALFRRVPEDPLKLYLAQADPVVGDIAGNVRRLQAHWEAARAAGADLAIFPELYLVGYPPEDLVLRPGLQQQVHAAVHDLATATADSQTALLVTMPWREDGKLYNAAALLEGGRIAALRYKADLPNYGVFDEKRLFAAGPLPDPVPFRGTSLGVMVCEDMWTPPAAAHLARKGAEVLIVPNGSPYEVDKMDARANLANARVRETGLPLVYVNQVGGQDELVFDGASFVVNGDGVLAAQLASWEDCGRVTEWQRRQGRWTCKPGEVVPIPERLEGIYQAMTLGLRDYVNKNAFKGVLIGLSGGIDSALSAAVAVDALGAERVRCVMMPYRHTSPESLRDAADCARRLGVRLDTIPIEPAMEGFLGALRPLFGNLPPDVTEENLQARARGVTLMALSNKLALMVLTTGNKSEMATGYATLYGDMCGGYSVLKDVYKTTVFALARWRNGKVPRGGLGPAGAVIPEEIIVKPPTAELRPNQRDQDTLPPYPVLDGILQALVDEDLTIEEATRRGFARETVKQVEQMVLRAEYKRRQAPPGVKITRRIFGRDRRYPITNYFRD
jgi:NAD+ synthase